MVRRWLVAAMIRQSVVGCCHRPRVAHAHWAFQLVVSVAFSPDGKTLASGSYDKTIQVLGGRDQVASCARLPGIQEQSVQ